MKNNGKVFEEDFQASCNGILPIERLKDPASSFNVKCQGCKNQVTRFSTNNICDFFGYSFPNFFLIELKSHGGTSIPFTAIIRNNRDKRLEKMSRWGEHQGVRSYVIFNWREQDNQTFAVEATQVLDYISSADRKSIPWSFTRDMGLRLNNWIARVHYRYNVSCLVNGN